MGYKSDIEIAQECTMQPITAIAEKAGIDDKYLEQYGKYKAKIDYNLLKDTNAEDGKLILVTAINPTPAGEGKTTTSVGLVDGLSRIGKKAMVALREPSLGPVFGVKGGAAGGGYAQVVPMEDINLHFTGDFHAIGAANNLLAAMIDNHIFQGNALNIDPRKITWKRCVDMNDRQLRSVVDGLGGKTNGMPREDGYDITVASEIMAVLCLASDISDLKERLSRDYHRIYLRKSSRAETGNSRRSACAGRYGSTLEGCPETKPGTDSGRNSGYRSRRTIRKHRTRLQLCNSNQNVPEISRLHYHRGRLRC